MEEDCMLGVWSVEPECRLWRERMGMGWRLAVETEHGDGVEIGCIPPHPMWLSARRGQKGSVCGPATWKGSRSFSCVSVVRGTVSSFLSLKGLSGLPSAVGWVGLGSWLLWRTGLSYTTDLFQNIWCWVDVK